MSVAVSRMPTGPGDHPESLNNQTVNPLAAPFKPSGLVIHPIGTAVRRLSAGAAFAEAVGIDLNTIGKAEAKKIMSIEHKVLGFRPPQGSFAAEAQAAAAKHPEVLGIQLDSEKLKEAAKIDAQRILAERNQSSGTGNPTSSAVDKAAVVLDDGTTPEVDLTTLSEADARKLMSHEHRALGFRPPPGSVAAEAQALVAKTTEAKTEGNIAKPTKPSNGSSWRRESNEPSPSHSTSRRGSADLSGEPTTISVKRSTSDEGMKLAPQSIATRRKSVNVSELSCTEKEVLLKEVALRDAERIKVTRGINGESISEKAHIDTKDLSARLESSSSPEGEKTPSSSPTLSKVAPMNLPGPVQEVQETVADLTERFTVVPTEEKTLPVETIQEHEGEHATLAKESNPGNMLRTETSDSVQIVGDVVA
ncbi:hypothetical protein BDY19DRAFT_918415 [Irpex rosettiformis]|uniref:Uncharacterized protein n=1 Tax=Irpex rosettiformis TaxID=378272 RepID=A0ACB8UI27_9APHY|nr:hypothetical protein BDY19DRAFT_918415 [Irpex rosettiformis]